MTKRNISELIFQRDTSTYRIDGRRVPSVTEILGIAGLVDFSDVPKDLLLEAQRRGTMAHGITAMIDRREPLDMGVPDAVAPYVAAYEKFRADTGFTPYLIEHPVLSLRYRFAGTLDRYGLLHGEPALIDLKCASAIARWVGTQLAGYEIALREQGYLQEQGPVKRFALRLKPDGAYVLHRFRSPSDAPDFSAAVRVAQWLLEQKQWVLE